MCRLTDGGGLKIEISGDFSGLDLKLRFPREKPIRKLKLRFVKKCHQETEFEILETQSGTEIGFEIFRKKSILKLRFPADSNLRFFNLRFLKMRF